MGQVMKLRTVRGRKRALLARSIEGLGCVQRKVVLHGRKENYSTRESYENWGLFTLKSDFKNCEKACLR